MSDDEEGSTLLLTIFLGALSLVLVLIVVAATSLYQDRKRLFTLADGAALAGAESFELTDVTAGEAGVRPTLSGPRVAAAVDEYLRSAPTALDDLAVIDAGTPDGQSATVTLSAYWRPPVVALLVPEGVRLEVTAVARSVFG